MNMFKRVLVVALVVGSYACNNDLNGIRPSIQSTASDMPAGICSMLTVSDQLKTNWRNTSPGTGRRRLDLYRYQLDYKVYATKDAEAQYQQYVLGNETLLEQNTYLANVCVSETKTCDRWTTSKNSNGTTTTSCAHYNTSCNRYEKQEKYAVVLGFGGTKTFNIKYNNMLNQTVKVPSNFTLSISNILAKGTTNLGSTLTYDNLSYQVPGTLPCFYTHIMTLYNARLYNGPEGFQGGRVATSEEVADGLDTPVTGISSFALLTKAEREELRIMNNESTLKRMQAIYFDRQSKFSKYLLDATQGKTLSGLLADAISDGRITKSLTLARKSVTGEALDTSDVMALFPGAADVIGEELAQGFAAAVAETAALQMSLDQTN